MTPEMLASLRERLDTGRGPITLAEIDVLLTYAEKSHEYLAKLEAWMDAAPGTMGRVQR